MHRLVSAHVGGFSGVECIMDGNLAAVACWLWCRTFPRFAASKGRPVLTAWDITVLCFKVAVTPVPVP